MFYKKINLLILFALIAGCSTENHNLNTKVKTQEVVQNNYGIWTKKNCQLFAQQSDVNLSITDIYKEDKARLVVSFNKKIIKTPSFKIHGLEDISFDLIAFNNMYILEIPTSIIDQARMHLNKTFLEVTYHKKNHKTKTKEFFSLQDLPKAIDDIARTCV